jgi:hypothetical protein
MSESPYMEVPPTTTAWPSDVGNTSGNDRGLLSGPVEAKALLDGVKTSP